MNSVHFAVAALFFVHNWLPCVHARRAAVFSIATVVLKSDWSHSDSMSLGQLNLSFALFGQCATSVSVNAIRISFSIQFHV